MTDISTSIPESMPDLNDGSHVMQQGSQPSASKFHQPRVPRRTEMRALDREIQVKIQLVNQIQKNRQYNEELGNYMLKNSFDQRN